MLSKAAKKRFSGPKSEEHKRKISEAAKKRTPISEDTRKKMGESQKKRWRESRNKK